MFQNGMSEEVQNFFMQQEVPKHGHVESGRPYEVDQGLYRNQYIDARAQMMGQQYQQFPYAGAAFPPKVANGDYLDPRMQHKGQLQQQYFEPVHQQQPSYEQSYEFQRQQQAMLARQQELFMGQGQGLGVHLSRPQMVRPQMETFPLNIRNTPGQTFSSPYGITTDSDNRNAVGQQLVGKPLEVGGPFAGGQSESEAIENLHDLFGGVEKLFADDQIQETKSAIPGLGSLGASLINGCEAELFGDSLSSSLPGDPQFFGRSIQQAFKQTVENSKVNDNVADRRLDHNNYSQQVSGQIQGGSHYQGSTGGSYMQQQLPQSTSTGNYVNDGLFHQYGQSALQQPLPRVDPQANERWQNNSSLSDNYQSARNTQQNNQMSRNTLQLFKDMDESDSSAQSGYQTPGFEHGSKSQSNSFRESKVDSQDGFRQVGTTFSLAVQDGKQKANQQTETSQVHFPSQHASQITEGGLWSKHPNQTSTFKYQPASVSEAASNQTYRLQPDRLLLDAGKQHQSEEVQKLLSFGNTNPNVINAAQNLGGVLGQANEDARMQNHQNEPAFKSPAYFEALEQQKQQNQRFQEVQNISRVYSSNGQHHLASPGFSHLSAYASADSVVEGKANDNQTAGPSTNALSWNASGIRQTSTPDAWGRGSSNSLEPSIAFKSPPAKPVLGTSLIYLSDKPSTPEVASTKPAKWKEEAYVENTPAANPSSSTALTDRGSFYSERFDHKLSKNNFQRSERSESEGDPSEHKAAAVWPHLSQNQGMQFPSTSSTFQDVSRRHVLSTKGETRPSVGPDIRHGVVSRPENTNHLIAVANQMKEKEDMMSTKVFQSSASTISTGLKLPVSSAGPNLALMSSPSPSQSMAPPFQQERPTPSRISSEMQRISREAPAIAGQTSSMYGHSQHRPAESDSINDIVQQQHQARVTPSVTQLPVAAKSGAPMLFSKPEQPKQNPFENRTIPLDPMQQLLSDSFRTSTPDERLSGPTSKHVEGSTEAGINNTDNSSTPKTSGNQFVAQSINTMNIGPIPIQQGLHQQLGMNFAGLSHPNAAMAHPKLSANQQVSQQLYQMSKEQHSVDLQRMNPAQATQASTLQQQQLQAALQAYALARGGFLPNVSDRAIGSSTVAAGARSNSIESPSAVGQAMKQQLLLNSTFANAVLPKKRKSEIPPLIPWRMAISQLAGTLPTIRPSELQWAVDTNRLPEKEIDEEYYSQDESLQFVGRARQRLKLTTQLMQQTLPPVPAALMQSNSADDRECSIYTLARLSLGEACRITANEDVSYAKTNTLSATSELIIEGFRDRIKYLERALQRLESLPLTLEFVKNMQYLDKVCVTNRLMKCHQELFPVNFTSQRRIQQVQRSYPQPYVTVAPMPNTLPEGFQLISL